MKRRKELFISIATVVLVLVAYNVVIARNAARTQRGRLLARIQTMPADTDCIFLGNSLVEAGCDIRAFSAAFPAERNLKPINLALGATSPVEHYLILKHALDRPVRLKYLIYGFFDDQLHSAPKGKWADLVGNRALSYYFPAEAATFYAPGSRLKRWELELTGCLPMVAERSSAWSKIELLRRSLEDIGMPAKKTNRYGRVEDFGALEASDVQSFNSRCDRVLDTRSGFSAPIQGIVQLAREHGAQIVFVEMPMPSKHRDTFYSSPAWTRVRQHLRELASSQGATYLSASDWVKDDNEFEDATHLNETGAKNFSTRLGLALAQIEPGMTHLAKASSPPALGK